MVHHASHLLIKEHLVWIASLNKLFQLEVVHDLPAELDINGEKSNSSQIYGEVSPFVTLIQQDSTVLKSVSKLSSNCKPVR